MSGGLPRSSFLGGIAGPFAARPNRHHTHQTHGVILLAAEMDRGSLHRCIHRGISHPSNSSLPKRHRVRSIVRTLVEAPSFIRHLKYVRIHGCTDVWHRYQIYMVYYSPFV
ncbi:hypothetical protein Vretimale_4943 [Volvox reticuliferus]|uniref:Uncharacterized protein n=1 Tax=Volvox reticuliferus TaxID=1737510 RepID=A0A8J4DEW4_9CHLO|nr:hypothetical protein Vretifemale_4163 [Volvox reticuliferus]GIL99896.1 hypothetical protein Vretimale_4943 [Volvox reticuliferus]